MEPGAQMEEDKKRLILNKLKSKYLCVEESSKYRSNESFLEFTCLLVSKKEIDEIFSTKEDYLGEYSREAYVIVPFDYEKKGCAVYCKKWKNISRIPNEHYHFENFSIYDFYKLCTGVPESFKFLKSPILECLRTAEQTLIAYELYLRGYNNDIILIDYNHGQKGVIEYASNKRSYKTKK